ncbi:MAG: bestrophin family protein [Myxococcota bacterium]
MIVSPKKASWISLIFRLHGTVIQQIKLRLAAVVLIAVAATTIHELYFATTPWFSTTPFSLIGLALSIFLGFRNNTSYDRFWEGRKLWGGVVNTARTITRRIRTLITVEDPETTFKPLVYQVAAYVHALRMHLRDEWSPNDIKHLMSEDALDSLKPELNKPIAMLQNIGDQLTELYRNGHIHPQHLPLLEGSLQAFTDLQGGCERIKSTPIPFSYNVLLHRIVAVYCFTLPFGLVAVTGWLTPIVTALIAYAFLGIDAIGEEIEEPFGTDKNDLPLLAISTMIEANVRQRLPNENIPELKKPDAATGLLT